MSNISNNKKFKDLDLLDSFLFIESTTKQEHAKFIAKLIIQRALGWDVKEISVENEKQYQGIATGKRGIRLDLQVSESMNGKIVRLYDIEPNKYSEVNLPKRSRYYQSLTDAKYLGASMKFCELPEYFSLWILPYDPFGGDRMVYTVKNQVVENPELVYNEGVTRLFLYTDGSIGGSEKLRALLNFFKNSNEANAVDADLKQLQAIISEIKCSKEVGERYMTFEDVINLEKDESYKLGFVSACRKLGHTDEEIIKLVSEEYSITEDEATKIVNNN